jgi:hypothetical protein
MRILKSSLFGLFFGAACLTAEAQDMGSVTGNFQMDGQYYIEDTLIGAEEVPEKIRSNTYAGIEYRKGNFRAGVRYESYQKPLIGFDPNYEGSGITYRFATYTTKEFDFTVGNFYDQFGSGMIFRAFEDRNLGIDNSVDGVNVRYRPAPGLTLKGMIGKQRNFFSYGQGIVRGLDAELQLNEAFESLAEINSTWIIGGSVVSKYQRDKDPFLNLPENVSAFSGRANMISGGVSLSAEYGFKVNDPSQSNNYNYNNGQAVSLMGSYSQKGFSTTLGVKRVDNMDFRSDRNVSNNELTLSYLPAFTRQHTYQLAAFYPYGTQPNGESAVQAGVTYKLPRKSALGGKYGTLIGVNFSQVTTTEQALDSASRQYETEFLTVGDILLFRDFNIEVQKKFNKQWKGTFQYLNISYDKNRIEVTTGFDPVKANIGVVDLTYKINTKNAIRGEAQFMQTKQDQGNWMLGLLEYTVSPHWFFAFIDQYNYGNPDDKKKIHYLVGSAGYNTGTTRVAMGYGKQRAGIVCVGGVCRQLPATNGFTINITSSF